MQATLSDIPWPVVLTGALTGAGGGAAIGGQFGLVWLGVGAGAVCVYFGTLALLAARIDRPRESPKSRRYTSETVRITAIQEDGKVGQFAEFPVSRDRLHLLASGLLDGQPFTEACWSGPRRPFTAREFSQVRAELIARRWAAWKSPGTPQRGAVVTAAGWAVMRYLAAPLPRGAAPRLELAT